MFVKSIIISLSLCLTAPRPATSVVAASDLLRDAEELLPYIRDVRRWLLM